MTKIYPAIFSPNDDGSITIDFPDLECTTEGRGLENAIFMARDCLALWLDTQEMYERPIPAPSPVSAIQVDGDDYVTLIDADPEVYARQRKNTAVRRTISLPKWLDEEAAFRHLSLSAVLQDALTVIVNGS
ncbi:MAG: type II toxin-antitoxin system HicB family antitoxin [Clostridia bacterium]|nr:type II toxin-antitoxin system HicB family antitoxin [Clostridia bacterium]